jgi:hypothetical protein
MRKIYLTIYFLSITIALNSCQSPLDQAYNNKKFEKIYSKDVNRINSERVFNEKENAQENLNTLLTPSSQEQRTSSVTNSFDYVDISQIGAKKQEKYFPDYETYEHGKFSNPNNAFSPRIFEISYNTYLNQPFSRSGVEFDFIDIPEVDSFGIKSSSGNKNYTLVPIQSLQDAIKIINQSRTEEDLEFSKKLIVDKKILLRKKNSLRNNEGSEYVKFFENSSDVSNIKIASEEVVNKETNIVN